MRTKILFNVKSMFEHNEKNIAEQRSKTLKLRVNGVNIWAQQEARGNNGRG